jgi:hypothetical protein
MFEVHVLQEGSHAYKLSAGCILWNFVLPAATISVNVRFEAKLKTKLL